MSTTSEATYLAGQHRAGFRVGDTVRVTRKAESHEGGWNDCWVSGMYEQVGTTDIIDADRDSGGLHLQGGYAYPYFVLELVKGRKRAPEPPPPLPQVQLNRDYTAMITPTHVKVGCQSIPHAAALKVAAAIRRVKARKRRKAKR